MHEKNAKNWLKKILGTNIKDKSEPKSKTILAIFVLFGVFGVITLLRSFAAVPYMSLEAEGSAPNRSGNLAVQNDANVSSGAYVQFGQHSTIPTTGKRCVVFLHGAGGSGNWVSNGDPVVVYGQGNVPNHPGGQGNMWLYFPGYRYNEIIEDLYELIPDDCKRILLHGFSNGGAAAAKIYCQGETFSNRLIGVIIDDPVMDHGTDNCNRSSGVPVVAYYTGGIIYGPGYNCVSNGYINCEGDTLIGMSAFASNLGITLKKSIHNTHTMWQYPPEYTSWW